MLASSAKEILDRVSSNPELSDQYVLSAFELTTSDFKGKRRVFSRPPHQVCVKFRVDAIFASHDPMQIGIALHM